MSLLTTRQTIITVVFSSIFIICIILILFKRKRIIKKVITKFPIEPELRAKGSRAISNILAFFAGFLPLIGGYLAGVLLYKEDWKRIIVVLSIILSIGYLLMIGVLVGFITWEWGAAVGSGIGAALFITLPLIFTSKLGQKEKYELVKE